MGHAHLGTEHLLLGLLAQQDTATSRALVSLRIDPQAVTAELEQYAEPADAASGSEDDP